jgi:hypothetical protein
MVPTMQLAKIAKHIVYSYTLNDHNCGEERAQPRRS